MARICGLCPSMPMWILRHGRRFGPPCPRAFHSPSPSPSASASMPVPSTARQGIAQQCPRGDRKVQRVLRTTTGDVHGRGLPASAHDADVRHGPVRADQTQEALDEAGRLPKGHAGKDLHRFRDIASRYPAGQRSGLSGSPRHRLQAADRAGRSMAAPGPFPHRTDLSGHCRAMPCRSVDRREAALLQRSGAARRYGFAQAPQPPRRIHKMNPGQYPRNKACPLTDSALRSNVTGGRFDPGMAWHAAPSGKHGRQRTFSNAAIQACLTTARKGIAQQCPERGPVGDARRRVWRKVHLAVDESTLEVRTVEITGSGVGPSRQIALQSPVGQWMRPCCLTCPARSPGTSRSRRSPRTVPMTPAAAATPSQAGAPEPSSHPGAMPGRGRMTAPGPQAGTRPCAPSNAPAGPSGVIGAATEVLPIRWTGSGAF